MDNILLVEDNESLRSVLETVLASEGYEVRTTGTAEAALDELRGKEFSLILTDLKLPQMSGIDFLVRSKEINKGVPVIVMTAYGSIDIAVKAIKLGAADFITKPFDPEILCRVIQQVVHHRRIVDRGVYASHKTKRPLLAQSPVMEDVLRQARRVAPLSTPVMILGESGTGKELLARYIHEQSTHSDGAFVAINCASTPTDLLESEFFGHEAGAFTGATERRIGLFEVADRGTLFLDEIASMPPRLQIKLLRAVQESEIKRIGSNSMLKVNARVISATNSNVEDAIRTGQLREDLYYRLGVVVIDLPPLRERREDIALLASFFIKSHSGRHGAKTPVLTPETLKYLESYDWPGNVRELENVIERALIFSQGAVTPDLLELGGKEGLEHGGQISPLPEVAARAVEQAETGAIRRVLAQCKGNKSKAAKILGVSYKTLLNKIKEYEISAQ